MKRLFLAPVIILAFSLVCLPEKKEADFIDDNYRYACVQLKGMLKEIDPASKQFPRTINKNGKLVSTSIYDWTPGFFPGSLWYAYEYTGDENLKKAAGTWTEKLEPLQYFTEHHDLGFMMYCSYGNAYRLTGNETYKKILVQAARSLSTRFNSITGSIKSWNKFVSWHDDKTYSFPVIIDNMMNLELLFFASAATGDTSFRHVAVSHALQAMKNQIRPDYSSYHVVCYDTLTGKVTGRETAQGYADNSTWARGQAWGIYGFTMVYRETKDERFLKTAKGMADFFIHHQRLPADKVPYWDFDAGQPGYEPGVKSNANKVKELYRDASAAAITASALLELARYVPERKEEYKKTALQIMHSLAGNDYRAPVGTNGNFLLRQSVGSIPHNVEIDVPLVYADYYFLESLLRYKKWYL